MDIYTKVRIIATCLTFLIAGAYLMTSALWPEKPIDHPEARAARRNSILLALGFIILSNLAIWTAQPLLSALVTA